MILRRTSCLALAVAGALFTAPTASAEESAAPDAHAQQAMLEELKRLEQTMVDLKAAIETAKKQGDVAAQRKLVATLKALHAVQERLTASLKGQATQKAAAAERIRKEIAELAQRREEIRKRLQDVAHFRRPVLRRGRMPVEETAENLHDRVEMEVLSEEPVIRDVEIHDGANERDGDADVWVFHGSDGERRVIRRRRPANASDDEERVEIEIEGPVLGPRIRHGDRRQRPDRDVRRWHRDGGLQEEIERLIEKHAAQGPEGQERLREAIRRHLDRRQGRQGRTERYVDVRVERDAGPRNAEGELRRWKERVERLEMDNRRLRDQMARLSQRMEALARSARTPRSDRPFLGERAHDARRPAPARRDAGGTDSRLDRIESLLERLLQRLSQAPRRVTPAPLPRLVLPNPEAPIRVVQPPKAPKPPRMHIDLPPPRPPVAPKPPKAPTTPASDG